MKYKHLVLFSLVAMGNTYAAETVTVPGGSIYFDGSIITAPCVVSVDSKDQNVKLGDFQKAKFTAVGSVSAPVPFNINLMNCNVKNYKIVSLTFKGITLEGSDSILAPSAIESSDIVASGVGIQILQDSKVIKVDGTTETDAEALLEGTNKLSFQAQYIATTENIGVGSANATVDFFVNYY